MKNEFQDSLPASDEENPRTGWRLFGWASLAVIGCWGAAMIAAVSFGVHACGGGQ